MNRYGQTITWGTTSAPHIFSGQCLSFNARDASTEQLIDDEAGDYDALALHSQKIAVDYEARIDSTSTNFLDLSAGAKIVVSGLNGVTLATRAVEKWVLLQAKTASVSGINYPDMVAAGGDASAGTSLSAMTPDQSGSTVVTPGSVLIYSTIGLTHAAGVVHSLTIEQILQITEDDASPDGKILGAASHGYMRRIQLDLLATAAAPAKGSTLAITGAPDHAGDYKIGSVEKKYATKKGMMFGIGAVWIPPFTAA